jgi:hypothetical protein
VHMSPSRLRPVKYSGDSSHVSIRSFGQQEVVRLWDWSVSASSDGGIQLSESFPSARKLPTTSRSGSSSPSSLTFMNRRNVTTPWRAVAAGQSSVAGRVNDSKQLGPRIVGRLRTKRWALVDVGVNTLGAVQDPRSVSAKCVV